MTTPVGGQAVVLGDDDREFLDPGAAPGALQPRVHGADGRPEIVQRAERVDVMESGGDGQLVVAVAAIGHENAGQVEHPVDVAAVAAPAALVTRGVLAMTVQNLLDERVGAEEVRGRSCHVRLRSGRQVSKFGNCGADP
ncbi:MAG: hypothetical protein ACRDRM_11065 [Pseudonocardiaceae bacterium]